MLIGYRQGKKHLDEVLRAMNELTGWDSTKADKKLIIKGNKRDKK